jgi:hypothetical protein
MTCGIYLGSPGNGVTDKVYIGLSNNIEERVRRHNSDMYNGVHKEKMQKAYSLYGEFEWEILEECTKDRLQEREKYYIELFDACNLGFNTYKDSSEAPILYGIDNGRVTEEYISLCIKVLDLTIAHPTYTRHKVAEILGAEDHVVSHLWYGHSNKWLADIVPDKYFKVIQMQGNRQIGGKTAKQQGIEYPTILSPNLVQHDVTNVREFAKQHSLDQADLSNVLNIKVASVKGWIVKDLDTLNPGAHAKFNSSKRGHYNKQFTLYRNNK